jgi:hypothetical protein
MLILSTSASSLRKIREKGGTTTRKLIGHSGPVYSVAFDPLSGSAAAPKYLLSCSADATTRLWSMETLTNLVAFRGHENPIWDVKWSPLGIYFATGSRDRTARLWSTDRISCLRVYAGHLSDVDVSLLFCRCHQNPYLPVCAISPKFFVSCDRVQRLDCTAVGRSTWFMCPSFHRTSGCGLIFGSQSRWALSSERWYVDLFSDRDLFLNYSQGRISLSICGISVLERELRK